MQLHYNSFEDLENITERTACVIAETVQAEAGVLVPQNNWLKALRKKCDDTGTLLVLDEIQCGFGRNGTLWAFEQFDVVPDILLLGKALGGGMPLGAFIADKKIMDSLSYNPVLGHINTFGGHPVCCAAGFAAFKVLLEEKLIEGVKEKEALFIELLKGSDGSKLSRPLSKAPDALEPSRRFAVRSCGLMIAIEFETYEVNKKIIDALIANGIFTDWFLFASNCLRIVPPLVISKEEITIACEKIIQVVESNRT
jgi:acetylornithine/N-succinyldiaminopimelate aminotransferase